MMGRFAGAKDIIGGLLILALGLGTVYQAQFYKIGSLSRMGPGFFPLSLGVILAGTGALILIAGLRSQSVAAGEPRSPEWRGWICICLGLVAFAIMGVYGGLLPATFATVFISALGDRKTKVWEALALSAVMTVVCFVVFSWALQMQMPLLRWG